ncbi:MAG: NAD-dependent dihydropyrimidine dehydrogenase subunit PreA [Deltaproteobacteria bacterium]|nr:NAD-dependent dihydropyrimidine dehydrogenase subunit PreA [Deltaproteobacteria bacterium]
MVDLSINLAGIKSPNPFWLASAPPANTGDQVMRAFDHGWGGAVWKTLGDQIVNVTSRFGALDVGGSKVVGFNNIELITDRPLEVNLREITEVKKRYPHHAVVVSLMVETRDEWRDIIKRSEDTGCDGLELNFGCPHGMCERGMGSAVGQEPRVLEEITGWTKEFARTPVLVKLTPNITDVRVPGRAAARAKADGLSLINTIKSIIGVDLDKMVPYPVVGTKSTNGGYCGPAVKPIAMHMVAQLAQDAQVRLPISGIGGISNWRDAAEFMALGATSVQVCTAVMHYGFRIVEDMIDGLSLFLKDKGMNSAMELVGRAVPAFSEWGQLDMNHKVIAHIDELRCIGCDLCHVACRDGSHDCIHFHKEGSAALVAQEEKIRARVGAPPAARIPYVAEDECTGCNLCSLVCPVDGCITMNDVTKNKEFQSWNDRVAQYGSAKAAVENSPRMWKDKH